MLPPLFPVLAPDLEHRLRAVVDRIGWVRIAEGSVPGIIIEDIVCGPFGYFATVLPAAEFQAEQAHADAAR